MKLCRAVISTASIVTGLAGFYFRYRVADDLVPALLRNGVDHNPAVALLRDRARHRDLLLGEAHPAKLHGQPLERAGVAAGGGRVGPGHLSHRVEAVEDVAGQARLLGELGIDVDRVEVARRAGVAVRQILVRRDLELRDGVALIHLTPP